MTNEERKAIEEFKRWVELEKKNKDKINNADLLIEVQEIIINLIEKQSKEIEELKKDNKRLLESATRNGGYKIC